MKDTYYTIASPSEGEFKDKGSKFLAFVFPADSEETANEKLEEIKQQHPKARHYCYAFRLGMKGETERFNDDGEPSGTAGRPILGQMKSADLTYVMAIVVRYFGGTKLGVSGLIEAYKESTKSAIGNAKVVHKQVCMNYSVISPYSDLPMIMESIKFAEIEMFEKNFNKEAELKVRIPLSRTTESWNKVASHYIGHSASLEDLKERNIRVRELGT